jgi:hypothetical protein
MPGVDLQPLAFQHGWRVTVKPASRRIRRQRTEGLQFSIRDGLQAVGRHLALVMLWKHAAPILTPRTDRLDKRARIAGSLVAGALGARAAGVAGVLKG